MTGLLKTKFLDESMAVLAEDHVLGDSDVLRKPGKPGPARPALKGLEVSGYPPNDETVEIAVKAIADFAMAVSAGRIKDDDPRLRRKIGFVQIEQTDPIPLTRIMARAGGEHETARAVALMLVLNEAVDIRAAARRQELRVVGT